MNFLWYGPVGWTEIQKEQWPIHVDTKHMAEIPLMREKKKVESVSHISLVSSSLKNCSTKYFRKLLLYSILVYCLIIRGQPYYKHNVCRGHLIFIYSTFQSCIIHFEDLQHVQKLKVKYVLIKQPSLTGNTCCFDGQFTFNSHFLSEMDIFRIYLSFIDQHL